MKDKFSKTLMLLGFLFLIFTALIMGQAQAMDDKKADVGIAETADLGKYLTDAEGMTLYYFTKDSPNQSACTGLCLERWPVFQVEVNEVPEGIAKSDFAMITREDGKKQTVYKEKPLYYFLGDQNPGDLKGQGVYDSWYVVAP